MFIVILSMPYVYIRIYTFNIDSLTDYMYKHLNYAVIARLAQNNISGGRTTDKTSDLLYQEDNEQNKFVKLLSIS